MLIGACNPVVCPIRVFRPDAAKPTPTPTSTPASAKAKVAEPPKPAPTSTPAAAAAATTAAADATPPVAAAEPVTRVHGIAASPGPALPPRKPAVPSVIAYEDARKIADAAKAACVDENGAGFETGKDYYCASEVRQTRPFGPGFVFFPPPPFSSSFFLFGGGGFLGGAEGGASHSGVCR